MTTNRHQAEVLRSPRHLGVGFCLLLVTVALTLVACGSQQSFANENDKLRAERLELHEEISTLQEKLALREGELHAVREQLDADVQPIEGVDPPRLAGIVLGVYSGPIDLDGDAKFDALRVYVRPIDQHSRQITAEGSVRIRLITTPSNGEPTTVLDVRFDPEQFHAAYRDGVTGTHYTLGADLPENPPAKATLHVALADAATGRLYVAEKPVELVRRTGSADDR